VSVNYSSGLPERGYGTISIDFGSAPENADKLVGNVLTEVDRLRTSGPTAEECAKVREQSRQSLETASKQNGFWLSMLQASHLLGRAPETVAAPDGIASNASRRRKFMRLRENTSPPADTRSLS
jgi:zinc protease